MLNYSFGNPGVCKYYEPICIDKHHSESMFSEQKKLEEFLVWNILFVEMY